MTADVIFAGKPGQTITVKTNRALTGATLVQLKMKKPDGTLAAWTPGSYDTITGDISYTVDGVTDVPATLLGEYVGQAYVEIAGNPIKPGKKFYFTAVKATY